MVADEYTRTAVGIISEYISNNLSVKLLSHFGLHNDNLLNITKKKVIEQPDEKPLNDICTKQKSNGTNNYVKKQQDNKNTNAEKKISSREKSLAKAASGAKSIKCFFTAK